MFRFVSDFEQKSLGVTFGKGSLKCKEFLEFQL